MESFELGICFDNQDPLNHGRIRVVPYEAYKVYSTVTDIQNAVRNKNINGNMYTEWSYTVSPGKVFDEFLAQPFLPSNLNMIPKPGQIVRLIRTKVGQLYIGPITNDPVFLYSTYREQDNRQKSATPSDIANNLNDSVLSGFDNEQIALGNNRVLIRLDHISNKTRKTQYPIFQMSKYKKVISYEQKTETTTTKKDVFLDFFVELIFEYDRKNDLNDKNIKCTVSLYDTLETVQDTKGKKGLTKKQYNKLKDYSSGVIRNQYTVRHTLQFNDVNSLDKAIEDIISSYKEKKIKYYNPDLVGTQEITSVGSVISLVNRIPTKPNSGGANNETTDVVPNLTNFVVRIVPSNRDKYTTPTIQLQNELGIPKTQPTDTSSLDYARFNEFNQLISKVKKYSTDRFMGNQGLQPPVTETKTTTEEKTEEKDLTVQVMYADKFLFLSSINSPDYLDNPKDGMSIETVSKFLSALSDDGRKNYQTYGWVRGEKLLEMINKLINIVLTHGHSIGQVQDSINNDARKLLTDLQGELSQEINGNNLNQPTSIINHNLRIN
jgi:hypothetical protein